MSLKAFHIVFILATFALAAFLAVWFFQEYARTQLNSHLVGAWSAVGSGLLILVYGRFFLKKLKSIRYL